MLPLSLSLIASILGSSCSAQDRVLAVSLNSRLIKPGDLFFALPGAMHDGHSFLADAKAKGASGAVVLQSYNGCDFGLPLIRVPNVHEALRRLAKHYLDLYKPKIVGITGSLGKTTTKELTFQLIRQKIPCEMTPGNANSQLGLPQSLVNMPANPKLLILEMGMSCPGEMKQLVDLAPPDIAVITQIAAIHIAQFESLEDIAREKAVIFSHPKTSLGIVNGKMPLASLVMESGFCPKKIYGEYNIPCPLPGAHNVQNFQGAMTIAEALGLTVEEIAEAARELKLPKWRLEHVEKRGVLFINDAYNACRESMCAALDSIPQPKEGRRIALLGDMAELGRFEEETHRFVAAYAKERVDHLFCLGERWKAVPGLAFCKDRQELLELARQELRKGDVALLKGSRPHALYQFIDEF